MRTSKHQNIRFSKMTCSTNILESQRVGERSYEIIAQPAQLLAQIFTIWVNCSGSLVASSIFIEDTSHAIKEK